MAKRNMRSLIVALALVAPVTLAHAMERVTLRNGSVFECVRHEALDGKVRLYLAPTAPGEALAWTDVAPTAIAEVEIVPDPPPPAPVPSPSPIAPVAPDLSQLLSHAGSEHNIDAELLASVVHAESAGNPHAVSRTGARGLMQLMPGTASELGVKDAFAPADNVEGGTKYLDALLTRYHDNVALALAAYNAGPAAVDRYRSVPPFRETRAYVARVIREFNRRKLAALAMAKLPAAKLPMAKKN
jgi:soluble lytic murein transglycosylase-like protein